MRNRMYISECYNKIQKLRKWRRKGCLSASATKKGRRIWAWSAIATTSAWIGTALMPIRFCAHCASRIIEIIPSISSASKTFASLSTAFSKCLSGRSASTCPKPFKWWRSYSLSDSLKQKSTPSKTTSKTKPSPCLKPPSPSSASTPAAKKLPTRLQKLCSRSKSPKHLNCSNRKR